LWRAFYFGLWRQRRRTTVRQFCQEQNWTAAGWPREAGLVPRMGPTILVSQHGGKRGYSAYPAPRPSGHRLC